MRAFIPVGLVMACTIPNPAFDLASTSGQSVSGSQSSGGEPTTMTPTSASEVTSLDPTVATTGGSTDHTTGMIGTTGMTGMTGMTSTTGTTGTDSSTGDGTTGEPANCWALDAGGWPLDGTPLNGFTAKNPRDPFITPDGLQLYYIANENPQRPYLSTRVGPGGPFPDGTALAIFDNDPSFIPAHPTVVNGGKELLFVSTDDVYSAAAIEGQPGKFGEPVPLSPPGTGALESRITATADSKTLIVARRDGPKLLPFFPGNSDRFYQYQRVGLAPGAAYPGPGNDVSPKVGTLNLTICPTLSPDGLHLFFGSTEAAAIDEQSPGDAVAIYYSSRLDTGSAFVTAQPLAIKHSGPEVLCPSSVTADGCQLVYHRFKTAEPLTYSMFIAVRAP